MGKKVSKGNFMAHDTENLSQEAKFHVKNNLQKSRSSRLINVKSKLSRCDKKKSVS